MKSAYQILERPLVTEKSMDMVPNGKYSFRVDKAANKIEIAGAVEQVFNVKVVSVNTMIVKGKKRRQGRRPEGKTPDWKKAIVSLSPGQKIELFEGM